MCVNKPRVALVVGGFPTPNQPCAGVFNLRAAQSLSKVADIEALYLRAWIPGRSGVTESVTNGIRTITITAPQTPFESRVDVLLYRTLARNRIARYLREFHLVHSVGVSFAGILCSAWARMLGIHHVTQVTGCDLNVRLPRIACSAVVSGWERYLHGVACNSDALARKFSELYPNVTNVHTIRRGVDLELFRPSGPEDITTMANEPVHFLFLGGFPPGETNLKGGLTLLKAWQAGESELARSGAHLCLAGPNSDGPIPRQWMRTLRFPDRIKVIGLLAPEAVALSIRAADAVLMPSIREGLPNVALEAAACGCAVFGSDTGGIPEVVVNGETGLVLPPVAINAWQTVLVEYASRRADLRRMGERARRRAEACFDGRRYPEQMLELYQTALREPLVVRARIIQPRNPENEPARVAE